MSRCSTPDTLIGLGGGGSKIVYRFMQQRWVLDEVLDDRQDATGVGPDQLQAATIDTATKDNWHGDKHNDAAAVVEEAIEDSDYTEEDRILQLHDPVIVPDKLSTPWRGPNLTATPAIRNLCTDQELNSWWMEEGREPLKKVSSSGFNGGVYRRRSVSKALHHISEHNDIDNTPNMMGEDVVIVAALGGGTGSGLFADLAAEIEGQNVHLFGILPHEGAAGRERTNAHAALSELEYLELTGESPFTTVTLMPHLSAIDDNDREFELAAIRSILAQQNGFQGQNYHQEVLPSDDDGTHAPGYAPFVFAIPDTIRYDLKAIEQAKEITSNRLQDKRNALRVESDFYDVVKQYLRDSFPDSAGKVLDNEKRGTLDIEDGDGLEEAYQLRTRMEEKLLGTFLDQQALKISGLEDTIERVQERASALLDEESLGIDDEPTTMEKAAAFIEKAPGRLRNELDEDFTVEETDGREYELVECLKEEIDNIQDRRDILKAVSQITAENTGLKEEEAKLIRRALLDVVLDDDTTWLGTLISDPTVEDRTIDLKEERTDLRDQESELQSFYQSVVDDIRIRRDNWYDGATEHAETLAAIKSHQTEVDAALTDLGAKIDSRAQAVAEAKTTGEVDGITLRLQTVGPLGTGDTQIDGIAPINSRLENMGVSTVPVDEIESKFERLKEAKKLELEHGNGGLLGSTNNAEPFIEKVDTVQEGGWFAVNKDNDGINVEHNFSAAFDTDKLDVDGDVDDARGDAIDGIVDAFGAAFVENGTFDSFEFEAERSELASVPQGISPRTVKQNLRSSLEASEQTDSDGLLDDVLPVSSIPATLDDDGTADDGRSSSHDASSMTLKDAYLRPIRQEYERVEERLSRIDGDDDAKTGLVDRLEMLKGLAEGPESVDVELPTTNAMDRRSESYGKDFAKNYEEIYEFDVDDEIDYRSGKNPYVSYKETEPEQMVGDPDHIGETDIAENPEVENTFQNASRDLLLNEYGKAPFNNLQLMGTGEKSEAGYKNLRVRQVYMSRGYGAQEGIGKKYDDVFEMFSGDNGVAQVGTDSDVYKAESYPYGWDDDITKVTFIGGIFLDNISLLTQSGGYQDKYEESYAEHTFIGSHHTIGLGGAWGRWPTLGDWVSDDAEEQGIEGDYGGYVYRAENRDVDEEFIEEIKYAHKTDGESAKQLFLDMLGADAYESTVQINGESDE